MRRLGRSAGAALGLVAGLALGSAHAAAPVGIYSGNAFATNGSVTVGPLQTSLAPTAYIPCPCLGTAGQVLSNSVGAATAGANGDVFRTGALLSTVQTSSTSDTATNESVSKITGLTAFKGLLTADSIVAVSRTIATATEVRSEDLGTAFVGLNIAGRSIPLDVAPNTVVALPGLGSVTLRQHIAAANRSTSALTVNMIAIRITQANSYGLPVGAEITIGHASSSFKRTQPDVVYSGAAYATLALANVPNGLSAGSGMTGLVSIGCAGTGGAVRSSNIQATSVGSLLSIGSGVTSGAAGSNVAKTTASLQRISLLNGLITADGVNAAAQMSLIGGRRIGSTAGSGVAGLKVLGLPIPITVPPNTRIDLPGIGHVVINAQKFPPSTPTAETSVVGLQVFITQSNALGLPVGANIIVGRAVASVMQVKTGA